MDWNNIDLFNNFAKYEHSRKILIFYQNLTKLMELTLFCTLYKIFCNFYIEISYILYLLDLYEFLFICCFPLICTSKSCNVAPSKAHSQTKWKYFKISFRVDKTEMAKCAVASNCKCNNSATIAFQSVTSSWGILIAGARFVQNAWFIFSKNVFKIQAVIKLDNGFLIRLETFKNTL